MIIAEKIKSPVTNSENTKTIEEIKVKDIINAYAGFGASVIDRFFDGVESIKIIECLDTGYRFYYPFQVSGDEKFYAFLQTAMPYYGRLKWEHMAALKQIDAGKVLEIGCGGGEFLEELCKKDGVDCEGIELNSEVIEYLKKKKLSVTQETIEQHSEKKANFYDAICSFQVIEHIVDVHSFLQSSIDCLKKGGLLIIGAPNNNPYLFQYDKLHALNLPPHHMGLWNRESLKNLEKQFPITLKAILIEPLHQFDYFWSIKLTFWKKENKIKYFFAKLLPKIFYPIRNRYLQKNFEGRNVLAIYIKK